MVIFSKTSSAQPEDGQECRGKGPLVVEDTVAKGEAFSDWLPHLQPAALRTSA